MNETPLDQEMRELLKQDRREVPEMIRTRIEETLAGLPERPRKKPAWKKWAAGTTAAAVVLSGVFASGFVSPTMAEVLMKIPAIGFVFRYAGDPGLQNAAEKGLTSVVNQTAVDQGVTLTVTDVLYDGARLSIGYLMKSDESIAELHNAVDLQLNGEPVSWPMSGSGRYIDDHQYSGILTYTPPEELPETFTLDFTVHRVGSKQGNWSFSLPVKKADSETQVYQPMITKTAGDVSLTIQKVLTSPSTTEVMLQYAEPEEQAKGNPPPTFRLYDDRGRILQSFGGSGGGETVNGRSVVNWTFRYGHLQTKPEYLVMKPVEPLIGLGEIPDNAVDVPSTYPLVLSQGERGDVIIHDIEFRDDKTVLHYETRGDDPYSQAHSVWFEDAKGKEYRSKRENPMAEDRTDGYFFTRAFPKLNPHKQQLKLVARSLPQEKPIPELEIKIPLE